MDWQKDKKQFSSWIRVKNLSILVEHNLTTPESDGGEPVCGVEYQMVWWDPHKQNKQKYKHSLILLLWFWCYICHSQEQNRNHDRLEKV